MILYLVYQQRRVFQSDTHSNALGFHLNLGFCQIAVDVAGRVTRGQNDRPAELPLLWGRGKAVNFSDRYRLHPHSLVTLKDETHHFRLEMHLTPTFENGVAHVLYHPWQFVGADMRMRVSQNGSGCPMLAKHIQYLVYTAPLLASGVEFAVGIGTGTSFPETIVTLAIHFLCFGDERKVFLALSHILSALYHNGTKPLLYQP